MTLRSRMIAGVLAASCCGTAWAESQGVEVSGVVRDATGSAVPGVTVTATHRVTNATRSTTTRPDGTYTLQLDAGTYTVAAALTGFRRTTEVVEVAGAPRQVDFVLQAQFTEELTVTALKRESTVLDVPFSVAAPTEQVLRERGARRSRCTAGIVSTRSTSSPTRSPRRGHASPWASASSSRSSRRISRMTSSSET